MEDDEIEQPRTVAVSQLESLGLSSYAARTFVALTTLGEGTAKEVSEVADVPRTRVYDAVEELQGHGLVNVNHATPKRFWAVSSETATRQLHQDYVARIDRLTAALAALEPIRRSSEQRGVWTVTGSAAISNRIVDAVDSANDEIVFMTVDELLDDRLVDRLRAASDRGVSIKLAGMEPDAQSRLATALPDAERFDSMWAWSATPAGRVLMVDERETLASVLVADAETDGQAEETAIWGTGETNSLVTLLKAMFTWQLGG